MQGSGGRVWHRACLLILAQHSGFEASNPLLGPLKGFRRERGVCAGKSVTDRLEIPKGVFAELQTEIYESCNRIPKILNFMI